MAIKLLPTRETSQGRRGSEASARGGSLSISYHFGRRLGAMGRCFLKALVQCINFVLKTNQCLRKEARNQREEGTRWRRNRHWLITGSGQH
jgi:hypothetical protein